MAINLLPLGSLVLLDGVVQKLMIVGRGAVYRELSWVKQGMEKERL